MKRATWIVFEGVEGTGKSTQTVKLVEYLRARGYKVLQTKEPGTPLAPITMQLRGIMLDRQYDDQLTPPAREFISQAIRSIHIDKVIVPALYTHDFIIQDRGILSGLAYGAACGNNVDDLRFMARYVSRAAAPLLDPNVYDSIIYLKGDVNAGLKKALAAKQEFAAGDAMEARGNSFLQQVASNMDEMSKAFNTRVVNIDGKDIETVFNEVLNVLDLGVQ
jgi:dTMP kinase